VRQVAAEIFELDVDAVAVCLLHSYANPSHEERVLAVLGEILPDTVTLVASSQIWPEIREYERATTTLMSGYIGPVMVTYLRRLEARLGELGVRVGVQVMESGGGVMSADLAGRRAVATIESGPAAGVIAARATAMGVGRPDIVSFDMGGTTAKVCVVRGGEPEITHEFHVGGTGSFGGRRAGTGIPIKTPAIDLAEVGAGGGSIAWVDDIGTLHLGPRSAGSEPGPACYGNGGEDPTTTDCNLVLGYLDPTAIAGGTLSLREDLANQAVDLKLAKPLGTSLELAASAVHDIANATMAAAVHVVTVQRGIDPRGFAMVAFGGAGPMHAARVAEAFDIDTVIIPPSCGVGSAVGLLVTDLSTDRVATEIVALEKAAPEFLQETYDALARAAAADLKVELGDGDVEVHRSVDVRFQGQAHQLTVPVRAPLGAAELDTIAERFYDEYQRAYGIPMRGPVELVTYRARVTKVVPKVSIGRRAPQVDAVVGSSTRPVWFKEYADYHDTPVYDRSRLQAGTKVEGPSIVQDTESTIVIPPRWTGTVDEEFNVVLTLHGASTTATGEEEVA
jgi:N-methylhydantoinase A